MTTADYFGRGVHEGGGDDAIHVRIGVLTLCGLESSTRNWVEAVHGAQADCWTCQQKLKGQTPGDAVFSRDTTGISPCPDSPQGNA
jgi:hypothetical protein